VSGLVTRLGIDPREFRRGAVAILPLWFGVAPFALAYSLAARTAGLSGLETFMLSLLVCAGSAQLAFVGLVKDHAGEIAILLTVLMLNLRHVLYGLSLNELLPAKTRPRRPVLAAVITDESYGYAVRAYLDGAGSPAYLFGASLSLVVCFLCATAAGVTVGQLIPNPDRLGLNMVFPLSYLALLLPLLRKRLDLLVAAVSALLAIGLSRVTNGGVTILISAVAAAGLGSAVRLRARRSS
jgi:4-azaleucine resistance transporter AzlC